MKKRLIIVLILFALVFPANANIVTININKDTYVQSQNPTASHTSDAELWLGKNDSMGVATEALLYFPLSDIPAGATINSATLYTYDSYGGNPGTYVETVYKITSSWAESVNWNGKPTTGASVASSNALVNPGWQTWDVTSAITAFIRGGETNYGFYIKETSSGSLFSVYNSREAGSNRPYISITYTANQAPSYPYGIPHDNYHTTASTTMSWGGASDPDGDALHYYYNVGTCMDCSDVFSNVYTTSAITSAFNMIPTNTYLIGVKTCDLYDACASGGLFINLDGAMFTFYNSPPYPPTSNTAGAGTTFHNNGSTTFSWTSNGDPEGDATASYYWIVGTSSGNNDVASGTTTGTTSASWNYVQNKTYYYSACASDTWGCGGQSTVKTLTFNNSAPVMVNNSITPTTAYTTDTLNASNRSASDADGDTPGFYQLWYKDNVSTGITTQTISSLVAGSSYKVLVTPHDAWINGTATYSNAVTIIGNVPANITDLTPSTSNYWVNYSWAGGNNTNTFNISYNNTWTNGSSQNYINRSVGYRGWGNISVYGYNTTSSLLGSLVSANTRLPAYTPPTPDIVSVSCGNFYCNTSWDAGSGNLTDSYNSTNGTTWINSTTNYRNTTLSAHAWQNLTIYAFNTSFGSLSVAALTNNTQVPNNPVVIGNISSSYTVQTNGTLSIYPNSTDADGDTPTFARDFSNGTFYSNNGTLIWITNQSNLGTYNFNINVTDGNGSVSTQSIGISIGSTIPTAVINLSKTFGNFYVNYTWEQGLNTDSVNISQNNSWTNGSTQNYLNTTLPPHGCSNITVYGYNISSNELGINSSSSKCLANNAPSSNHTGAISSTSFTTDSSATITLTNVTDLDSDTITSVFVGITLLGGNEVTYSASSADKITWTLQYSTLTAGTYSITDFYISDQYTTTIKQVSIGFTVTSLSSTVVNPNSGGSAPVSTTTPGLASLVQIPQQIQFTNITDTRSSKDLEEIGKCLDSVLLTSTCSLGTINIISNPANWWVMIAAFLSSIITLFTIATIEQRPRNWLIDTTLYGLIAIMFTLGGALLGFNTFIFNYMFDSSLPGLMSASFGVFGVFSTLIGDHFSYATRMAKQLKESGKSTTWVWAK